MACRVLSKIEKKKLCKRDRISANEPYFYFIDKRPGQIIHSLGVSWIYVWIKTTLESWQQLHCFDREVKAYKLLRPDGFFGVKNTWTKKLSFYFVEMDIAESGNPFKKVDLYNSLYESDVYTDSWWVPLSEKFPTVIIVTTGNISKIQKKIESDNRNGLNFKVYSLDQVKEECFKWVKQRQEHSARVLQDS